MTGKPRCMRRAVKIEYRIIRYSTAALYGVAWSVVLDMTKPQLRRAAGHDNNTRQYKHAVQRLHVSDQRREKVAVQ